MIDIMLASKIIIFEQTDSLHDFITNGHCLDSCRCFKNFMWNKTWNKNRKRKKKKKKSSIKHYRFSFSRIDRSNKWSICSRYTSYSNSLMHSKAKWNVTVMHSHTWESGWIMVCKSKIQTEIKKKNEVKSLIGSHNNIDKELYRLY